MTALGRFVDTLNCSPYTRAILYLMLKFHTGGTRYETLLTMMFWFTSVIVSTKPPSIDMSPAASLPIMLASAVYANTA